MPHAKHPYLEFGPAGDPVAWTVLAIGLLTLGLACSRSFVRRCERARSGPLLCALGASAALLSAGYIFYYLRGGPRIVDATYYYLAGRALAHGRFAFEVPGPLASFAGRFLLASPTADSLGVLFPPGYPAALALAFKLGVPLAVGPVLAAGLVLTTYRLAKNAGQSDNVARVAALLSVLSAALRYHTADTMSHGFAALLFSGALSAAFAATARSSLATGALSGWLIATRPVTGLIALCVCAGVLAAKRSSDRETELAARRSWRERLALFALALLPGLALLVLQQRALTGSLFGSTQLAYYARADGPPGCFRYGFGAGIGCLFEHGDYVRARLPHGYGFGAALATTWRRIAVHTLDVANFAPLALAVPLGAFYARRSAHMRWLALAVVACFLAYAPFYFEGSFPGGGARFFADVLPLEHVLLAAALVRLQGARFATSLALLGFALHTHTQHQSLRDREGGRPMFEANTLVRAGIERGLVFVDTDHGFALGFDPGVQSADNGVVVARQRNDGLDALLWARLHHPKTYCYNYDPGAPRAVPSVRPCMPPPIADVIRVEGENLWPTLGVAKGWAHPEYLPNHCVSRGRGLALEPTSTDVQVSLAVPSLGQPAYVRLGWWSAQPPMLQIIWSDANGAHAATPTWNPGEDGCWLSEWVGPAPERTPRSVQILGPRGVLDLVELKPRSR